MKGTNKQKDHMENSDLKSQRLRINVCENSEDGAM